MFGGPYSEWRAWLDAEQEAARQAEVTAKQEFRKEKRQRIEAEVKLAHRSRTAKKAEIEKRVPKIIAHGRKMAAEVSAGKLRTEVGAKEDAARTALDEAGRRLRSDASMKIELPDPQVSRSRRIAMIGDGERSWIIQGPDRVALIGRNGAGKTTLLERLVAGAGVGGGVGVGESAPMPTIGPDDGSTALSEESLLNTERPALTATALTDRIGYLPQRIDGLDENRSVFENIADAASQVPEKELRNRLARFLIRGATAERPVAALSGGCLLYTSPSPRDS